MSADSCDESFLSVGSEVREVAAEGVDKHGDEMDCNVKMEVTSAQNNLNTTVKEEKKNSVFDISSSSDEGQPGQPALNSEGGLKVKERRVEKLVFANQSTGEKRGRGKLKMKPFPLSGIQVFKQVMYGKVSNYLQSSGND